MKTKLRLMSAILILSMLFPICSGIIQPAFAADISVKVYIDSYSKSTGVVNIHWDAVPNVVNGTIEYHVPSSTGFDTVSLPVDAAKNSAVISGIQADIIYDFKVSLINSSAQTYVGRQYFLPQISFYAEQVEQQSVTISGGGVETGDYPSIKLKWNMPRVFNNATNTIQYANESAVLSQIDGSIKYLNFSINILGEKSLSNVLLTMSDNGSYTAAISGEISNANYSDVKWDSSTGQCSFYLLGVKDASTLIPSRDSILVNAVNAETGLSTLPQAIALSGDNQYVLAHQEILPGTIYTMSMNTLFVDSDKNYVGAVADGLTENPLLGSTNYTYTPVRFQLTKDTFDTVYVRIYRINQGGVNMPKLYYEVQTSNVPSSQDTSWTRRKKLDDSYFKGEYAITGIDGINSKNILYYRVVVKSDSVADRVQSLNLAYKMEDDTARPPVPKDIDVIGVDLALPDAASGITDNSSDITISWDKPSNWDQIKGSLTNDIYFHFLLNIDAEDLSLEPSPYLEANGKSYGMFPVKYRLVKYVSANSPNIDDSGDKLVYKFNGFELFKGEDENGNPLNISNVESYPTYFLPNKTYYLQMYTTKAANRGAGYDSTIMSEKSLVTSFTTLTTSGRDVPIPSSLEWVDTTVKPGSATDPAEAAVKIRFSDLDIDWSNYTTKHSDNDEVIYDLYMSNRTDASSFKLIGTTDTKSTLEDVVFTKQTLGSTIWVYASINKFTASNSVASFGYSLSPNTTYYFMVKVRLRMINEEEEKQSIETVLLPVTTPRAGELNPDESAERPLAPTDFSIAVDADGNPMITGQTVTFEWTVNENEAQYNLISTADKVEADTSDTDNSILLDTIYKSFINSFGNKDNNIDNNEAKLTLNPNVNPLPSNFEYNSATRKCRYTINTWLYPNKIYYFSLRAEIVNTSGTKTSVWVSIPVTTSLIESPSNLQVINDCELAFYWFDTTPAMTTDNYSILLKKSTESKYAELAKSSYKIVKDESVYYGRLFELEANTTYDIKVVRMTNSEALSTLRMATRNDYYQIDLKWQGNAIDAYSGFEIAVKTADDSNYAVLNNDVDLEQYVDISTHTYPYYIEKQNSQLNTNYYTYNARIKLVPTILSDGSTEHLPLKPNTKYFIKVRAVKTDSSNLTAVTPSKYVGPVETRTEFSQDDYDDEDNNTNISAKFLDLIEKLEQESYWGIGADNGVVNKIYVRDDKVKDLLDQAGKFSCTIDISDSASYVYKDEIYLARDILEAIKSSDKNVILKCKDIEYTIRPDTFDAENIKEFKSALEEEDTKDVFLKLDNTQSTGTQPVIPSNTEIVSKMNIFSAQVVASTKTNTAIKELVKNELYNEKTGLVQKKVAVIKNPNNTKTQGEVKESEVIEYLNKLYEEVKSELSYYLEDTLEGVGYKEGVLTDTYDISKFSSPLGIRMAYKADTIVNPYVVYGSAASWQKLTQNLKKDNGYLSYFVNGTGKYVILSSKDVSATVSDDNTAKPYISKFSANYDLTAVFPGVDSSFNSDLNITVKESILLYELISVSGIDEQTDIKAKAKTYGIDKIINITNVNRNITRQEAAAIAIKLYCQRTGADYNKLKAAFNKVIKDDKEITKKYAMPVYMSLKTEIMTLDSSSRFYPTEAITRAQFIMVIQKMLDI
ncbi:S-layer family protein [Ruminiclostridium sufflavum DSM 19573]|uniref:S-layer family protein n=1 Tax=Ruminiclostridium sufflavum DSM 19573 TaxID=1121337 RepID=A0A318YAP0_9FIRM|nr:S-layer homology domain-containing protein [Ruminiclostridium sufflavum]PYG89523.1 S-layer family protein [Ruminiclostridium sufflavum DSM 19573]